MSVDLGLKSVQDYVTCVYIPKGKAPQLTCKSMLDSITTIPPDANVRGPSFSDQTRIFLVQPTERVLLPPGSSLCIQGCVGLPHPSAAQSTWIEVFLFIQ
ncbi:unnamed protein product [Urochloa humidicola]